MEQSGVMQKSSASSEIQAGVSLVESDPAIILNMDRSRYRAGESMHLAVTVLDEDQKSVCGEEADLRIELETPSGWVEKKTMEDGITSLPSCIARLKTFQPDFAADLPIGDEGTYRLTVRARTPKGTHTATWVLAVSSLDGSSVDVRRSSATRTYAGQTERMTITLAPAETVRGTLEESVPIGIRSVVATGSSLQTKSDGSRTIRWDGIWEKDQVYTLSYDYTVADDASRLLSFGPLTLQGSLDNAASVSSESVSSEVNSSEAASSSDESAASSGSDSSDPDESSEASSLSATSESSSVASNEHSSASDAEAGENASSETTNETQTEEQTGEPMGFIVSFIASLFGGGTEEMTIFSEDRTWTLVVEPPSDDTALDSEGTLELTPKDDQTTFEAKTPPTFRLLDSLGTASGAVNEEGQIDQEKAYERIIDAMTDTRDVHTIILSSLIEEKKADIAHEIATDSVQAANIQKVVGESSNGQPARTDIVEDAVAQVIDTHDAAREELATNLLDNHPEVQKVLSTIIDRDVKDRIVESAAQESLHETDSSVADVVAQVLTEKASAGIDIAVEKMLEVVSTGSGVAAVITDAIIHTKLGAAEDGTSSGVMAVTLRNAKGETFKPSYHFEGGDALHLALDPEQSLRPGMYTLLVSIRNPLTGEKREFSQDFTWGVLAINADQDRYHPGETAHLAFGVLDDLGAIVCDAALTLRVVSPDGSKQTLSSSDGSIVRTGACGTKEAGFITPDYEASLALPHEGTYVLALETKTKNGSHAIEAEIVVAAESPIVVTRRAATRLWPFAPSPMDITIDIGEDTEGSIVEHVPDGFIVTHSEPHALLEHTLSGMTLTWHGSWKQGDRISLHYDYDAPDISPEFYLLGPLMVAGSEKELRAWQIANDDSGITRTWDGGGADNKWSTPGNWSADTIPGANDKAVFDSTGKKDATVDASFGGTVGTVIIYRSYTGSITLSRALTVSGSLTHSGSSTTGITWTQDSENDLRVTGNLSILSGATVTVKRSSTSGNGSGQSIRVDGNLLIATGATVTADGQGFAVGSGPSGTDGNGRGGSHGGIGGTYISPGASGTPYGSFTDPTELGSGGYDGGSTGGGAVVIACTGTATINGKLSANGGIGSNYGGGAGGSVNLRAGTLTGQGTIRANGATSTAHAAGGGGGRISLNGVTTDNFAGLVQVNGGTGSTATDSHPGRAGTIYFNSGKRTSLTLGGAGNLRSVRLGSDGTNDYTFGTITILSGGTLEMDSKPTMNSNNGGAATLNVTTLDIRANGVLKADGLGFSHFMGPGAGAVLGEGANHGGYGSTQDNGANTLASIYGSLTDPRNLGSGGYTRDYGGGAIIINATTVLAGGIISANGAAGDSYGGGAGGTINIAAATLAGTGTIRANGNYGATNSVGGGGGRVSVRLSSGTSFGSVAFQAFGGAPGSNKAAAGTIYEQTSAQGAAKGNLIIDNNNVITPKLADTFISSSVTNTSVGSVALQNAGKLKIGNGITLTLNGTGKILTVNSATTLYNSGTLVLGGTGSTISGTFTNGQGSTVNYIGQSNDVPVAIITSVPYRHIGFNNPGTTFNVNGNLDVNGTLSLTGGTLKITSAQQITLSGSWIQRGSAAFTAGTGTVIFDNYVPITLSGSSAFNNLTLDSGLVGYWKFDEGVGTVAKDSSRNGNNGTLTSGPVWSGSTLNGTPASVRFYDPSGLKFDGVDDYVNVPHNASVSLTTYTVSVWENPTNTNNGSNVVLTKRGGTYNYLLYFSSANNNTPTIYNDGLTPATLNAASTIPEGAWSLVTATYDGTTRKIYINGVLSNSDTPTGSPTTNSQALTLGSEAGSFAFKGLIDDVRVYNRALNRSEIAALAAGNPSSGSGKVLLGANLDVNGNLGLYGSTLDASSSNYSVTLSGSLRNSGDFTKRSGGFTLDGTNQTLSGSTIFNNLTKTVTSPLTLTLDSTARQNISGSLVLQGSSTANRLSLRSNRAGSGARLLLDGDAGSFTLSYLDVKDSNASGGKTLVCGNGCLDNGNNVNWNLTPVISGTVYTDEGFTSIGAGKTVALGVNGGAAIDVATTDSSGNFSLSGATLSGGSIITLYLDNNTEKAVTVTKGGTGGIAGIKLYKDRLVVKTEDASQSFTSSNLSVAKANGDSDITALYTMSSLNTTIAAGKKLFIWTGSTMSLGGTLTAQYVHLKGSLIQNSNIISVTVAYTQSGGTFTGSSAGTAINISGYFTLSNGTFTSTTGTFIFTGDANGQNMLISGGAFVHNGGTLEIVSPGGYGASLDVPTSLTLNNFTVNLTYGSPYDILAIPGGDTIIVLGTLALTDGQINAGTVEARGDVTHTAFNGGTGLVNITGSATRTINLTGGADLPGVTLNAANTTINGPTSGTTRIKNGLNIQAGTFTGGTGIIHVQGNFTLAGGTFTAPSSTVIFEGISTGQAMTISGGSYSHNNGTTEIRSDPGFNVNIDVLGSFTLNNLRVDMTYPDNTWNNFFIAAGDTIVVKGTFTLVDGRVSTGNLELRGNAIIGSTANGGTSPIKFAGTGTQVYSNTGGTIPTGNWTVAKPSGVLSLSGGALSLSTSGQDLIMTGGTLDLNGFALTVNDLFVVGTGTTLRRTGDETVTGGPDFVYRNSTIWYDDAGGTDVLQNLTYENLILGSTGSAIFRPGSQTLDINKSLTISGGTLQINGGQTITLSGSWLRSAGGSFSAGTGAVILDNAVPVTLSESSSFNTLTLDTGLVGYWKFDDGVGTVARDSSRFGRNGALVAGPLWSGTVLPIMKYYDPSSLKFDGSDDRVTLSRDSLNGLSNVTATFWLKTVDTTDQAIISGAQSGSDNEFLIYFTSDTSLYFYAGVPSANWAISSIATGTWRHVAIVRNDSADKVSLYIDGVLQSTQSVGLSTLTIDPNGLVICQEQDSVGGGFDPSQSCNGYLDDIRIYSRVLNASEINALAKGNPSSGSGRVLLGDTLDVNGNLGLYGSLLDTSGSNYNLTIGGNYQNAGEFTKRSGTVTLDGAGVQTVSGSTIFQNLTKTAASATSLFFDYTSRQSASGTLTLQGASAAARLALRSTRSGSGARLLLDGDAGSFTLDYLDVKDSNAFGGKTLRCSVPNCANSGNNTNWTFVALGTVNGIVWVDTNGNGVREGSEGSGLSGVTLSLTGTTSTGGSLSLRSASNSLGRYAFSGTVLSNSTGYTDTLSGATVPAGYIRTRATSSGGLVLGTGTVISVDFGFVNVSTITGSVYVDTNGNGVKDASETQIFAGASLSLTGTTGTGGSLSKSAVSGANGQYAFQNLPTSTGNFTLVITPPTGYTTTSTDSRSVAIGTGGQLKVQNFGYQATASSSSSSSSSSSESGGVGGGETTAHGSHRGDESIIVDIEKGTLTSAPVPAEQDIERIVNDRRAARLKYLTEHPETIRDVEQVLHQEKQEQASTAVERTQEVRWSLGGAGRIAAGLLRSARDTVALLWRNVRDTVASDWRGFRGGTRSLMALLNRSAGQSRVLAGIRNGLLLAGVQGTVDASLAAENALIAYERRVLLGINDGIELMQLRAAQTGNRVMRIAATFLTPVRRGTQLALRSFSTDSARNWNELISLRSRQSIGAATLAYDSVQRFMDQGARGIADTVVRRVRGVGSIVADARGKTWNAVSGGVRNGVVALVNDLYMGIDTALDGVARTIVAVQDGVHTIVDSGRIMTRYVAGRFSSSRSQKTASPKQEEKYRTTIMKKDKKILIATLHMEVLSSLGDPLARTPVVLFSTPKIAVTSDKGIATFHDVETGKHRLEIHVTGEKVEARDFILEPPSDLTLQEKQNLDVVLPVVQVVMSDIRHGAAGSLGIPLYGWVLILLLVIGNSIFVVILLRRRRRIIGGAR